MQRSMDRLPLKENLNFLLVDPRDDTCANLVLTSVDLTSGMHCIITVRLPLEKSRGGGGPTIQGADEEGEKR